MKLVVASDHAAVELKDAVVARTRELGHDVVDLGVHAGESADYPAQGERVARAVVAGEAERGIALCGTGIGISIAANKVPGTRAVVCSEPYSAVMSRRHNDTNVLALGGRVVGVELGLMIVEQWLDAEFEGGRHARRVGLISNLDAGGTAC